MDQNRYDLVVIGGGFYGCIVALEAAKYVDRVVVIEKETDIMQRASYVNQARIHQGYHYPRSILTALRSRINFSRFVQEFNDCVCSSFDKYYAIGRKVSKVTADQFRLFCSRIGAPLGAAPREIKALFNPHLIENVFAVQEYAFDAVKLKQLVWRLLSDSEVEMMCGAYVDKIVSGNPLLQLKLRHSGLEESLLTKFIFNCTYSQINQVLTRSQMARIPLKHELTEMALVEMPDDLKHVGITVMDGPFFSVMPFPPKQLHSLSHVRYTPHHYWTDGRDTPYLNAHDYFLHTKPCSQHQHMLKDVQRYIPVLSNCRYEGSLWEVKTLLPRSEIDDSRPILFKHCEPNQDVISIMGGKIDNVFDIREKISHFFQTRQGPST